MEKIKSDIGRIDPSESTVIAAREFVYRNSTVANFTEGNLSPWHRYLKTSAGNFPQLCGDMSSTLVFILLKVGVPARSVQLAARDYVEGRSKYDTHVTVEAFVNNRWIVFDPTFNASFTCDPREENAVPHHLLSIKQMKSCVEAGHDLIVVPGVIQLDGRTVKDYYLPYKDLLFAFHSDELSFGGKNHPSESAPFLGWLEKARSQY